MDNNNAKNCFALLGVITMLLVVGGASCILAGCDRTTPTPEKTTFVSLGGPPSFTYQEIVIDGCQYICYDRSLTLRGNCTNSIHIPIYIHDNCRVFYYSLLKLFGRL